MAHYMVHTLICLCSYYICMDATLATVHHKEKGEIVIPQRVNSAGEFVSHALPQHFKLSDVPRSGTADWVSTANGYPTRKTRRRRQVTEGEDAVHYLVPIAGQPHHLEVRPNRRLIAPGAITEIHDPDGGLIHMQRIRDTQCHFLGHVRNHSGSVVAISTCHGLTGYIRTKDGYFMIEPTSSSSPAGLTDDPHPHLVYQRHSYDPEGKSSNCETREFVIGRNEFENIRIKRHVHRPEEDVTNMYTPNIKNDLHLELLLVLDKTFLQHHKDSDDEHYLMTIINMAHRMFVQESLGRSVYLVVVRIIRLEYDEHEINLATVKDPCKTLAHFQIWQEKINPGNDSHPNHHDLAILFTRIDIYNNDNSRDLLGLSHESGVCEPKIQAILIEDVGLMTGIVVAHEIGHSVGIPHDEADESGCNATLPNGLPSVMSSNISPSAADWSQCSKRFLSIFLDSGFGRCLIDTPADHPFDLVEGLPGIIYDGNWQCRSMYGSASTLCDTTPRCDILSCQVPDEGCIESFRPPADGTLCGDDKWCYHGECLQIGMRPTARDGGWGPWSAWSECTRTCGTGVSHSDRRCDSPTPANGGEFCKGKGKRYMICATQPCPSTEPRFRDLQCGKFNDWVFPEDGVTHAWRAHMTLIDDPCSLNCINECGAVVKLADRVIDGTNCLRGIRDICISGKCETIPCDLTMDSGAVEDVCGVCHGDGTTCTLKEGIKFFTAPEVNLKNSKSEEAVKLLDIPEGTQNIQIDETDATKSKIEVRDLNGTIIYIEGDELGIFDVPGTRAWLGMLHPEQETLHIPGPTALPLSIWIVPMADVTIKYSLAVKTEKRMGAFVWDYTDWTPCSSVCGVGYKTATPRCIEQSSGEVDDRYCEEPKPELKVASCESLSCPPRWFISDWQRCIRCVEERTVRCVQPVGQEVVDIQIINPDFCPKPKPIDKKPCGKCAIKSWRKRRSAYEENRRLRRKVFHRQHKNQKIYSRPQQNQKETQQGKRKRKRRENKEENEEDQKSLMLERGLVNVDKQSCANLKLVIKENKIIENKTSDVTIKETSRFLKGKAVIKEMEKIEKCRPEIDQI